MLTMPTAAPALQINDDERERLERLARSSSARHRTVQQARALLLAADDVANNEIGRRVGVSSNSVRAWRARFADKRMADFGTIALGRVRRSWLHSVRAFPSISGVERRSEPSQSRPARPPGWRPGK